MFTPLKSHKKVISLLLTIFVLFGLMSFTIKGRQEVLFVEDMLLTVVAPIQGVFQRLTRSVESIFVSTKNYKLLLEENSILREKLTASSTLEVQLAELHQENHRLRQMLNFQARSEHDLIPAQIISRNSSSWFDTITINKGSAHGVRKNMAVVTSEGLVGNVLSVSRYTSQVLLLTESRPAVSAVVQRSREPGQVVGVVESAPDHPGYLKMVNLPKEANIQPGDTVISSGLGGVFPKGLVIGFVLETGEDEYGILQYALLRPAANFNRLEEVFVVIPLTKNGED